MPAIDLRLELQTAPMSMLSFVERYPGYSIGLDGFVLDKSQIIYTPKGPYGCLDHHKGDVPRLDLRSTCDQVHLRVKMGLLDIFRDKGSIRMHVYADRVDEDLITAWFFLKHHVLIIGKRNRRLDRLKYVVDRQDTTAGAYPLTSDDISTLEQMAWIFQPYRESRLNGQDSAKDLTAAYAIVAECERRIKLYLDKKAERLKLDFGYQVLGGGQGWSFIQETGAQGRQGAIMKGVKAYVSYMGKFVPKGMRVTRHRYVAGRISDMIDFPLAEFWSYMNRHERCPPEDCWGSSDLIGGSPTQRGSTTPPEDMQAIVNAFIKSRPRR